MPVTDPTDPTAPLDPPDAADPTAPRAARRPRLSALRARHKFALLGVLGMLMVATPLTEVVRRQGQELQLLLGARAGLEPLARAVDVQRALLAHRGPASQVLSGHGEREFERRARQDDVDRRMAALTATLVGGRYAPALEEDAGLRNDWLALVGRIAEHRISAAGSDAAHRLLVEQVVQVMDLVAEAPADAAVAGRRPAAAVALGAARRGARADDEAVAGQHLQSAASAIATLDAELADAAAGVRRSGFALWALLGLLAALVALLAASLWRQLGGRAGAAARGDGDSNAGTGRDGPESRQPAEHLLRRLRSARSVGDPREEAPPSRL